MINRTIRKLLGLALASALVAPPALSLQGPPPRPSPGQPGNNRPGTPAPPGGRPGIGNRPQTRPTPGTVRPQPPRPTRGTVRPQPPRPYPGNNRPQPPRPNPGNNRPHPPRPGHRPPQWGRPPHVRPSYNFRPNDRDFLRRHYRSRLRYINRARRPPFIVGGYFPVGDIGYLSPVPPDVYGYLPPPPPGYQVGYFDGYVVVYDPVTYFIANLVDLLQ